MIHFKTLVSSHTGVIQTYFEPQNVLLLFTAAQQSQCYTTKTYPLTLTTALHKSKGLRIKNAVARHHTERDTILGDKNDMF